MKLSMTFPSLREVRLPAFPILKQVHESAVITFHTERGFRSPLSIYNTSLTDLFRRTGAVLDLWLILHIRVSLGREISTPQREAFLEALDHMLDAFMEHMDDCESIIQCFYPRLQEREARKALAIYNKRVRYYRSHIGAVVNYLKHNQGQLRVIELSSPKACVIGYFVEGPVADGVVGPVPHIHGGNTAFSLHRDMRMHICSLFAVSGALAESISDITKIELVTSNAATDGNSEAISKTLNAASLLPNTFFPDEINKIYPRLDAGIQGVVIEMPSPNKAETFEKSVNFRVTYISDGVTSTYGVPYMFGHQ